ncbi:MAG: cobyrinic acid a,c-diamide synthase [Desulfobacteraceae bacterium CG2_30_51_40]|nr:MAG: cobyrinic acid a,c-diamide synthase [Desulfobacteraceae bacterium CG2_30_51_40]
MVNIYPRVVIAGLKGASGKTFLCLGIVGALKEKALSVSVFKKGPDFIDAGWLSLAAGTPCRNLDPFLMSRDQILASFQEGAKDCGISIIEGNRGLFDGLDYEGLCSTAQLARILEAPIILVVDVTMATRTIGALVKGCQVFESELLIKGVILNRVGSTRQESLIRKVIDSYCGIPTLGAIPKLKENQFPERHMGLVPHHERIGSLSALRSAKEAALSYVNLPSIIEIASEASFIKSNDCRVSQSPLFQPSEAPRIGVVRDDAFWFYYPENIDSLKRNGANLIYVSALSDHEIPKLDCLYIGGGFPETMAEALSRNTSFRESIKIAVDKGLPVYAECGGLMYLGEDIFSKTNCYPMAGVLPISFSLERRPQGHGYTVLEVSGPNPFYKVGQTIKGHEFHYSRPILTRPGQARFAFRALRGGGIFEKQDGLCFANVLATYTHVHAGGFPLWADYMIKAALRFRDQAEKMSKLEKIN